MRSIDRVRGVIEGKLVDHLPAHASAGGSVGIALGMNQRIAIGVDGGVEVFGNQHLQAVKPPGFPFLRRKSPSLSMLTCYRRHLKSCIHRSEGRLYRHCKCPVWVDGFLGKEEMRESLKTSNWQAAHKKVQEWEANGRMPVASESEPEQQPVTIEQAQREFLANCQVRQLKQSSIQRHQIIFRQMNAFAAAEGLRFMSQLDIRTLTRFRATWKGSSGLADQKKLERLRAFCKFAVRNGHLESNPALALEKAKIRPNPTLPFSPEEMVRILAAASQTIAGCQQQAKARALRTRALVLLLRYSGLRISDAVSLAVDRIQNGRLFLYTQKTGQHVYVPLPPFVLKELEALPYASAGYFFWTGVGSVETCRKKQTEALSQLFRAAGVRGGHAHRFRDTFAVELLKAGTPIERVSTLLGHSSVKITEKHYNPWNRARQEQAEQDVMRSWASDSVALLENSPEGLGGGTPQVHENSGRAN